MDAAEAGILTIILFYIKTIAGFSNIELSLLYTVVGLAGMGMNILVRWSLQKWERKEENTERFRARLEEWERTNTQSVTMGEGAAAADASPNNDSGDEASDRSDSHSDREDRTMQRRERDRTMLFRNLRDARARTVLLTLLRIGVLLNACHSLGFVFAGWGVTHTTSEGATTSERATAVTTGITTEEGSDSTNGFTLSKFSQKLTIYFCEILAGCSFLAFSAMSAIVAWVAPKDPETGGERTGYYQSLMQSYGTAGKVIGPVLISFVYNLKFQDEIIAMPGIGNTNSNTNSNSDTDIIMINGNQNVNGDPPPTTHQRPEFAFLVSALFGFLCFWPLSFRLGEALTDFSQRRAAGVSRLGERDREV
jgi:hypothetical protein